MVETTVGTLNTERSEQFIRLGIPEVLANVSIQPDQVFAGFSTADQHEHRSSVFTAHGVSSRAVADKFHVEPLQNALSQLTLWESIGSKRARVRSSGTSGNGIVNTNQVGDADAEGVRSSRIDWKNSDGGSAGEHEVTFGCNLFGVQLTITILPNQGGRFSEDVHDVGQLFPTFHCEAQVFESDVRGVN